MKVAFVHDWFTVNGGAEKVAKSILDAVGEADIYCLFDFFNDKDRDVILKGKSTKKTFLQRLPFCKKLYRNFLPFFPRAIESFDLSSYDIIISSSFAVAKSVRVKPGQIHISYCHSPMRFIWDLKDQYIKNIKSSISKKIANNVFNKLQPWDVKSSQGVTHFIANSKFVASRIKNYYDRESKVIYPPINTDFFTPREKNIKKEDYYIVISRLVPYKKVDLIVESFRNLPDKKLIVIGDGPEFNNLPQLPNVKYLGYLENIEMRSYLRKAKALIVSAVEDFGISSLEAQSCGIPVLALRQGGYLETVFEHKTGLFFDRQDTKSIVAVINEFEGNESSFDMNTIREHALLFKEDNFIKNFRLELNDILKENDSQNFF